MISRQISPLERKNLLKWRKKKTRSARPQKFQRGDVVYLSNLPPCMSHFEGDGYAVVLCSYNDTYGGENTKDYEVWHLKGGYKSCWYPEQTMTKVEI